MSITRVGSTKKFADNWENIFGGGKKAAAKPAGKKGAGKKSAKKTAGKPAKKGKK